MPATAKKDERKELKGHAIVSEAVRSYENDPFFVKKTEQARKTLLRVGLPDDKKKQAQLITIMPEPKKESIIKGRGKAVISNEVRDYSKDPFFIKKGAEAKEALSKIDLSTLKKK